jgi:hypothetical protein
VENCRMDSRSVIADARAALHSGRTQEGLALLKSRLRAHPEELDVRRELAEAYRALGHADQAGRFGLLVPGWSSQAEHDAFIHAFITPEIGEMRVEQLVVLPRKAALPGGVEALVKPPGRFYRKFRPFAEDMTTTAKIFRSGVVVVALGTMIVTTIAAFIGTSDVRFVARAGTTFTAIPVIGWSVTWGIANVVRHRWFRVALAIVALVPALLVFIWLAPSPGAYLPWESPQP